VIMDHLCTEGLVEEDGTFRKIANSRFDPTRRDHIEMSGHRLAVVLANSNPSGPPGISTSVNSRTIDPACSSSSAIASTPFAADKAWKPASSKIVSASIRTRKSSSATRAYGESEGFGMPFKP
jgi:hypothetical protein